MTRVATASAIAPADAAVALARLELLGYVWVDADGRYARTTLRPPADEAPRADAERWAGPDGHLRWPHEQWRPSSDLPVDRRLGLRRGRGHPGRPEGVRALRRPRDDRDHGAHRAEHGRRRDGHRRFRRR